MPRENVLIKSKDNIDKIKEILTKKYKWYKEIVTSDVVQMFHRCYSERGDIDSRDFVIMSYAYNMDNPDLSEKEYKEHLRNLISAFIPRLSFDELDDIKASIRSRAEIEREEQLKRVGHVEEIAEAYRKEHGKDDKYETMLKYSTKKLIEDRYNNILKELENDNLDFTGLVKIANTYHVEKTNIPAYAKLHYKDTIENAHEYLDFLDDFKKEMVDTYKKLDPLSLKDNYKCIMFGMMTQTFAIKRDEFKEYYDSKYENVDDKTKAESIHIKTDLPQYIIAKDMRQYDFNAQAYSDLTIGSEGLVRTFELDPLLEWQHLEKMKVQASICDRQMNFTLHNSFYNIQKNAKRYLETFKNPRDQVNPLTGDDLKDYRRDLQNTFATQVANTTLAETSDSQVTGVFIMSPYEKFFIDGVQIREFEPLKSYIEKHPDDSKTIMELTNTLLMNAVMEGNHYISYIRFKEYKDQFGYDIVPVKFIHNKEAYVESKTGWWSKLWARLTNINKKYEKLRVKDQNAINRCDNKIKETMSRLEVRYYERRRELDEAAKKNVAQNQFEINVLQDLNKTVEYDSVEELGLKDNSIHEDELNESKDESLILKK